MNIEDPSACTILFIFNFACNVLLELQFESLSLEIDSTFENVHSNLCKDSFDLFNTFNANYFDLRSYNGGF